MNFKSLLVIMVILSLLSSSFLSASTFAEEKIIESMNEAVESDVELINAEELNSLTSVISSTYDSLKENYIVQLKPEILDSLLSSEAQDNIETGNAILGEIGLINSVLIELSETQVTELLQQELVESIEVDREVTIANEAQNVLNSQVTNSSTQIVPWGIYSTGAYAVNSVDANGEKVKVAVLDTGISKHSELSIAGNVSFIELDNGTNDENGHGTQLAGTIAATDDLKGIVGITGNVELYSVKVIDGKGKGYISSVIQGIEWAINQNINVINLSFVSTEDSKLLHQAIKIARDNGILVIAAAGNSGLGDDNIKYPAKYPEVLAVGSVDQAHRRSIFSSTGPELDIVAPGTNILTTNKFGGYSVTSGTSIAAAHVTGAAALLWSKNDEMNADKIIALLKGTATNLGNSNEYGTGIVNVAKALNVIDEAIPPLTDENIISDENIWFPSENGEINIASYDQTGNGQIIVPGEVAEVSVKLNGNLNGENIHEKIIIEVTPASQPGNIIAGTEIYNPQLFQPINFRWITTEETLPGTYYIKYKYPARPTGEDDDLFVIYVEGKDHPAPSNLTVIPSGNSIKLSWSPLSEVDSYSLLLNGVSVGTTTSASYVFNNLEPLTQYKLAVAAHYQDGESSSYSEITASTIIQELIVFNPINVDQKKPTQLFTFKPATTGVYRIFTSPNQQTGTGSDTQLTLYSDSTLTKQLSFNDDFEHSSYSEIKQSLIGGETYYIKLSTYGNENLQSSITADVVSSVIPYIQLNQAMDINESLNNSTVYVFVPTQSGEYNFSTTFYNGRPSSRENDTQLSIYTNANLSTIVPNGYNDDTSSSVFSEAVVSLTQGVPYFIKVGTFDDSKVFARLMVAKKEQIPVKILNKEPVDISKSAGEYALFQFTPELSGVYRMFTSSSPQDVANKVDTEITLFNDISMNNKLAFNDDVEGESPYGSLYSKMEYNLSAGTTYYITVKNLISADDLKARFIIEDSFNSSKGTAQSIILDELLEVDNTNKNLSISSLYDTDYFVLNVLQEQQININISKASGLIEDDNGIVYGYFSENGDSVFELSAGRYYLRIQHDILRKTRLLENAFFNQYDYYIGVYLNEILYDQEESVLSRSTKLAARSVSKSFDATPASKGVSFTYKNKIDTDELVVEIYPKDSYYGLAYSTKINNQKKNNSTTIKWYGDITSNRDIYANRYQPEGYNGYLYWAKNGVYRVEVYPKGKTKYKKTYYVNVDNDGLNEYNWIPIPPKRDYDGKKVTKDNKQSCEKCRNYFSRYIRTINSAAPETDYTSWSRKIYGLNGVEQFWSAADDFVYNPNLSIIDNMQKSFDKVGLVPILGAPADGLNGVIYLMRGNYKEALLSGASMIPYVELAVGAKKVAGLRKYKTAFANGPCNCFAEGTIVPTDSGNKNIEDIKLGDMVLSKDDVTGEIAYKSVEYVFEKNVEQIYIISVDDQEINTTNNHPFWIVGQGWVTADHLNMGDELQSADDSKHPIKSIEVKYQSTKVYNLTVKDFHTFFATDLALFTHNLVCNINKYHSNLPTTVVKKTGTQPSTILANELIAAGISKPPLESGVTAWAAHHIVPEGEKNSDAANKLRKIYKKFHIEVNSAANGVWLPMKKGEKTVDFIDENTEIIWKAAAHNGRHSKKYYEHVLDRLDSVELKDAEDVLFIIREIRTELLSGKTILGKLEE